MVNYSALQAVEWCNPSTSCYGFCCSIAIIASGDGRPMVQWCVCARVCVCVCVCVTVLKGDGCTFCSSVLSEFSVFPLTSLRPRGGSGSTRVAPGVFLNLLGQGFRDAVARAVSFLSRPVSSSSLHSRWCS